MKIIIAEKRSLGKFTGNKNKKKVDPVGFEPTIFSVQGRRLPARPRAQNKIQICHRLTLCQLRQNADERTRTSTPLRAIDPKSIASPIPPRRQVFSIRKMFSIRIWGIVADSDANGKSGRESYPRFCRLFSRTVIYLGGEPPADCGLSGVTRLHPPRCDEISPAKPAKPSRLAPSCTLA